MKPLIVLCLAAAAPLALGDTVTQTFNYSYDGDLYDPNFSFPTTSFDTFDTMGGTRQLTGVSVHSSIDASMTVTIENYDDTPYDAGTWYAEVTASLLLVCFDNNGVDGPNFGLGGLYIADITGDLSAGTGGFPFGTPGDVKVTAFTSGHIETTRAANTSDFGYFTSGGSFDVALPLLTELFLSTPPAGGGFGIFGGPSAMAQTGAITLTYEYTTVPAPATVPAIGCLGLLATRRRR